MRFHDKNRENWFSWKAMSTKVNYFASPDWFRQGGVTLASIGSTCSRYLKRPDERARARG
jgi:hypothetical protein